MAVFVTGLVGVVLAGCVVFLMILGTYLVFVKAMAEIESTKGNK